jgi:riboflavin biosynthesis pyrimidine reductase
MPVRGIPESEDANYEQPVPIVLDPLLVSMPSARLFKPGRNARVLCLTEHCESERATALRAQGVTLVGFPAERDSNRISFDGILAHLAAQGIGSLLIEPGVRLIPILLRRPELLDALVVTVAPIIVGSSGRAPTYDKVARPALRAVNTMLIGQDVVMASHFLAAGRDD